MNSRALEKEYKSIDLNRLSYILSISENFDDFKKNINDIIDNYNSINPSNDQKYLKRRNVIDRYNINVNGYIEIQARIRNMTNNDLDEMNKHIDNTSEEELRNMIENFALIKKKNIPSFRNLSIENLRKKVKVLLNSYKKGKKEKNK